MINHSLGFRSELSHTHQQGQKWRKIQRATWELKEGPRKDRKEEIGLWAEIHENVCFFRAYSVAPTDSISPFTEKGFFPGREITSHLLQNRLHEGGESKSPEWGRTYPWACWGFQLEPLGQEVERGYSGFASKVGIKGVEEGTSADLSLNTCLRLDEAPLLAEFPVAFSRFL